MEKCAQAQRTVDKVEQVRRSFAQHPLCLYKEQLLVLVYTLPPFASRSRKSVSSVQEDGMAPPACIVWRCMHL